MIVIHATFPIDPDERDRALDLIRDLGEQSRAEDGIIEYRAAVDVDDENVIRFSERYEDEAAFGAHAQTDHFEAFAAELPDLLAGQPEVMRFDVSEAIELEL